MSCLPAQGGPHCLAAASFSADKPAASFYEITLPASNGLHETFKLALDLQKPDDRCRGRDFSKSSTATQARKSLLPCGLHSPQPMTVASLTTSLLYSRAGYLLVTALPIDS